MSQKKTKAEARCAQCQKPLWKTLDWGSDPINRYKSRREQREFSYFLTAEEAIAGIADTSNKTISGAKGRCLDCYPLARDKPHIYLTPEHFERLYFTPLVLKIEIPLINSVASESFRGIFNYPAYCEALKVQYLFAIHGSSNWSGEDVRQPCLAHHGYHLGPILGPAEMAWCDACKGEIPF